MSETATQLVQIEKPVYGGAFLARAAGKATFVPLTLPGEQLRVRTVGEKSGYVEAEVVEIETPAAERVASRCPHFGTCGGCQYQHASYAAQLEFKRTILRETLERGGVRAPEEIGVLAGEPWGSRNRIRLAFDAEGRVGYRGRRSHAVVPIVECPITAPVLVDAAFAFAEIARLQSSKHRPAELTLFCNADETAVLAGAVFAAHPKLDVEAFGRELAERVSALTGLEISIEGRKGQPSHAIGRWGATSLPYRAAGFEYRVDQGAFFQVNRWLVDALAERVTAGRSGRLAWDLFAGVGLFARQLTAGFKHVVAVESAPASTQALTTNLKHTRSAPVRATTLEFLHRDHGGTQPDLVVVDPPRAGLGPEVTDALIRIAPAEIVYVSCDPTTLTRDLRTLLASGYALSSVTLADLFPQTFHLETVVELRRA
jgi:23S rRNA (uracil1939-C5)-methyltransferase